VERRTAVAQRAKLIINAFVRHLIAASLSPTSVVLTPKRSNTALESKSSDAIEEEDDDDPKHAESAG
jgi:hypothetical protein